MLETLEQLNNKYKNCKGCELCQTRQTIVFGSGNPNSKLLLIGEAPGKEEDLEGRPFIGRSGQLLRQLLCNVKIDPEQDAFITNIVKCRPPNNRNPKSSEIKNCLSILEKQLSILKPELIVLIGSASTQALLGKDIKISKKRGQWLKKTIKNHTVNIMPIFHPSYLLRNPSSEIGKPKWLTQNDLKKVAIRYQELNKT